MEKRILQEERELLQKEKRLIDIEFVAQLGVLVSARLFPRVLRATGTLSQLGELMSIGWLSAEQARSLQDTACSLRQQRMMKSLAQAEQPVQADTTAAADIFKCKMGESSRALP